jgi:thiamine kinase-like enzyme
MDDLCDPGLLDQVPCLAATPRTVTPLPGGLTNRNYKVSTPEGTFVARVWSPGDLLAINRDHEHRNSVAAAAAGVGAPVVAYRPEHSMLVLGFIEGRTFHNEDLADPLNIPRVAEACPRLHAGPRFASDFNMFEVQQRYLPATAHGFAVPAGYAELMPQGDRGPPGPGGPRAGHGAVQQRPGPPANFIDDGAKLWLIDYEYSGNNAPCFELGNIWGECGLSTEALADLVRAYHGFSLRNKIARAQILGLIGKYGWTLWGAIQHASSPIAFDFWGWAMERFETAAAAMTSPAWDRLLDEAARDD